MPISITAKRWASRSLSSVSGMPMSLLRLPSVASTAARVPTWAARTAEIISFTVVLPLLPVSATSGSAKRARQWAAPRQKGGARATPARRGAGGSAGAVVRGEGVGTPPGGVVAGDDARGGAARGGGAQGGRFGGAAPPAAAEDADQAMPGGHGG